MEQHTRTHRPQQSSFSPGTPPSSRPHLALRTPPLPPLSPVLRKSFSADSFSPLNHHPDHHSFMSAAPQTAIPQVRQSADQPPPGAHPRDVRFPLSTRSRGASVSTTASNPHTDPEESDNDLDRDPRTGRTKARQRPEANPGLPLPAKVSTASADRDPKPARPPAQRTNSARAAVPSSSLANSSIVNTQVDRSETEVSIVVVGAQRCGKSALIDKGLKHYRLSKPTFVADSDLHTFSYTVRDGFIPLKASPDVVLHVLEVDASALDDHIFPGQYIWPHVAPPIDGAIVCYDASDASIRDPVAHVEALLRCFRVKRLPAVVFACKSDLDRHVEASQVHSRIQQWDVGLVEISAVEEAGKEHLRLAFQFMFQVILASQRTNRMMDGDGSYNPASPDVLVSPPPWDISRASTATPTAVGASRGSQYQASVSSASTPRSPTAPTSPTRSRSASDLNSNGDRPRDLDREKSRSTVDMSAGRTNGSDGSGGSGGALPPPPLLTDGLPSVDEVSEDRSDIREKEGRAASWATLDELLEKLLFLAVSGDDSAFISHFLLTYRRFASPRNVVLAMQKRMRWLDQPCPDPMFACFAQMRICHLLEVWIQRYPHDFAVGHASGALNALVRSIVSKTHLLHYGSDFLPFLEGRPLVDKDAAWAMRVDEHSADDADEAYAPFEEYDDEDDDDGASRLELHHSPAPQSSSRASFPATPVARERKSSLPLSARAMIDPQAPYNPAQLAAPEVEMSRKETLKELQNIALALDRLDVDVVAQEITRIESRLFAAIEPRHWLQHTLVAGVKDAETDPIARFMEVSYHLAEWVVSIILCHDRMRQRVRQIEKFTEIAAKLRYYNNYSALRAFVAGIHKVMLPGDEITEAFRARSPGLYKTFQSWEVLLQSARSHRAYRMALHNTKGACIPALEVHLQDLIKAHVGNADVHPDDPRRIHWAKFNMMGKFIQQTMEFQVKCKNSVEYHFRESREHGIVRQLLMRECKMDLELQKQRLALPTDFGDDESKSKSTIMRVLGRINS